MPTGYTAIIEKKENLSLREFTLRCARAFGACIEQRDEDVDVLPKVPELSTYHLNEVKRLQVRLVELRAMTPESAKALYDAENQEYARQGAESRKRCADLERRYRAMRAKVENWTPPSAEHEGLKKFMLEQIDLCKNDWEPYELEHFASSPSDWLKKKILSTEEDIIYHAKRHEADAKNYERRKKWIEDLYESFGA